MMANTRRPSRRIKDGGWVSKSEEEPTSSSEARGAMVVA